MLGGGSRGRNFYNGLLLSLALAVTAAACVDTPTQTVPTSADPDTSASLPEVGLPRPTHADGLLTGATVGGGGPVDTGASTVVEVANLVIADLEHFWTNHWNTVYPTLPFRVPTSYALYESGQIPTFACANPNDNPGLYVANAFYCPTDSSIVFESSWFQGLWNQYGDFGPASLLAHEWGHHVQNLLTPIQQPLFSIQSELQADCFAGVWARNAGQSGGFRVNASDIDEASATFYGIAGQGQFLGWFAPGEHGTNVERQTAFLLGYGAGTATGCTDLANYRMEQTFTMGSYVVGLLQGETVTRNTSSFSITGLQYGDVVVQMSTLDLPASTTAVTTLADSARRWAPDPNSPHGSSLWPYHAVEDLTKYTQLGQVGGTSVGFSYSQMLEGQQVHGYYFHHNSGVGTGLVIDVYRPGLPPLDKNEWADLAAIAWRAILSFRLD